MKKTTLCLVLFLSMLLTNRVSAQYDVKPFEHLSVSANVGTLGAGVQVATPVHRLLSLRAGVLMFTYTYNHDYSDSYVRNGETVNYEIPLKAKANLANGMILADFFPIRNTRIHLTGGFMIGTSDIIKVSGYAQDKEEIVEIGDVQIRPATDGKVAATLRTNAFKPYLGLGFGSSVTKKRVGFKFELGAMFHGSPKIKVTSGEVVEGKVEEELSSYNKFLKNFSVYPVMNFQLNFRAF